MSGSRRRSETEFSSTAFRRPPNNHSDDSRERGRDEDRSFRGDRSFYRRDFARSRDRTRTFDDDDGQRRSKSFSVDAETGHERPRLPSRQTMQDHRFLARQSPSPDSKRNNSLQSSPNVNSGSRPVSPNGGLPRSEAATLVTSMPPPTPGSKLPSVDLVTEESAAGSKTDGSDKVAIKDPRLRRINEK